MCIRDRGQSSNPNATANGHATRVGNQRPANDRQQRGLAVTIPTDDPDAVSGVNTDRHIRQHDPVGVFVRDAFQTDEIHFVSLGMELLGECSGETPLARLPHFRARRVLDCG